MPQARIPLAKVMTQAKDNDILGDQGRRGPGNNATDLREPADSAGADDAARGRADSGEAQPVLTAPVTAEPAQDEPAQDELAQGGRSALRTFRSLRTRNYRLFATGQVVSNSGTWMQRVAQDWLVLQLTHGSGTAPGIPTRLPFRPLLARPRARAGP